MARDDLGADCTDEDRLERYAAAISESRTRAASMAFADDPRERYLSSYRTTDR